MFKTIEVSKEGYVYVVGFGVSPYYKIGCSSDVEKRLEQLATLSPYKLELVCEIPSLNMYQTEREYHARYAHKRERGEWFKLDEDDLQCIRKEAIVEMFRQYIRLLRDSGEYSEYEIKRQGKRLMDDMEEIVLLSPTRVTKGGGVEWNVS